MTSSIELPNAYGYVILSNVVLPFITNFVMGGTVMAARKEFKVAYPNLYATPGFHKQADEFNRVQRGHQSMIESLTNYTAAALFAGLQHPITTAICGVFYCLGNVLYLKGYADTSLDVKTARYKRGGAFKPLAQIMVTGIAVKFSGKLIGWW